MGETIRLFGHRGHTRLGPEARQGLESDLDLLACYLPQRRGGEAALPEESNAWAQLADAVGDLAGHGHLLVAGDLNAEGQEHVAPRWCTVLAVMLATTVGVCAMWACARLRCARPGGDRKGGRVRVRMGPPGTDTPAASAPHYKTPRLVTSSLR